MKRRFVWNSGYFVALALVLTPLMDVTLSTLPWQPNEMAWRFAATGVFAEGVLTGLLGLFLALALAVYLEHRAMVRTLGVVSALGCVLFLAIIALFALEAPQMRRLVATEARQSLEISSMAALVKHLTGLIGTGLLALAARAELKRAGGGRGGRSQRDMVVSAEK